MVYFCATEFGILPFLVFLAIRRINNLRIINPVSCSDPN